MLCVMQGNEHRFLVGAGGAELRVRSTPAWLAPARVRGGAPRILRRLRSARACREVIALEALRVAGRPALLAVFPRASAARLNGAPPPRVALLRAGDELRLPDGPALRLVLWCAPDLGPPAPEQVGSPCGLCRVELTATTRVLACAACACLLHAEGEDVPEPDRLTCATTAGACPQCTRPLRLTVGIIDDVDG